MTTMIAFSVLMPVYAKDHPVHLEAAFMSLVAQTRVAQEVNNITAVLISIKPN